MDSVLTNTSEFWEKLEPGSIVTLSASGALEGTDHIISRILDIRQQENICRWMFFELKPGDCDGDGTRWLWVKIVDRLIWLHIMEIPEEFCRGDRYELATISAGQEDDYSWVFQNPEECDDDPELPPFDEDGNVILNHLRYSTEIDWDGQSYAKTKLGDLCGSSRECPVPGGNTEPQLATIAEYQSINDNDKPDNAIFLEIGPEEDERGGMISLMVGWRIAEINVKPFKV